MDIENDKIKTENNILKGVNKNLRDEIQKYKEEDIAKTKEETKNLKKQIELIEKEKSDINIKFQNLKNHFNHDFLISKKIRLILEYLTLNNQTMEAKIKELNIIKEKNDKKYGMLQQSLNEKNNKIESKEKMIEDLKKKINEEKVKYTQLNNEYNNLLKISNEGVKKIENEKELDTEVKKSFSELSKLLNQNKEIVPFLYNKLENVEKENKNLKEQIILFYIKYP